VIVGPVPATGGAYPFGKGRRMAGHDAKENPHG
jgi:hypothetical protein